MTSPVSFLSRHNHKHCIASAVQAAEALCSEKGLRFTQIRRRVLELIWSSHQPIVAYDLLRSLREEKQNAEPPTVYRALDFLLENNLIHRIESLNAFVGCDHPEKEHSSQFMICSACKQVVELHNTQNIAKAIGGEASRLGFKVSTQTVEVVGLCPICQ